MVKSNYSLLIEKLDQFIRKYYLNNMIRGALLWAALVLLVFLAFNFFEHRFYFSAGVRKVLFFSFLLIFAGSLIYWLVFPLLKYYRLGLLISHEHAARILGDHFPNVNDRLVNILQLRSQMGSEEDRALIEASIDQKSDAIRLVPFKKAIDLKENRKYLRYALPPLLILLFFLFAAPSIITDSTYRIIKNDQEFEKAAPFSFVIQNEKLESVQFEDFTLKVNTEGEIGPDEIFLDYAGYQYRMQKAEAGLFTHTFNNLQEDAHFGLFSGEVDSREYEITVLAKPRLTDYDLDIKYPSYTKRPSERISNIGNVIVPEGSVITWKVTTANADHLAFSFNKSKKEKAKRINKNQFSHKKLFRNSSHYSIGFNSEIVPTGDSLSFFVNVLKDKYPSITVERFQDSVENLISFFAGTVGDDYGLEKLTFNYEVLTPYGSLLKNKTISIKQELGTSEHFSHVFDINEINLKPGEEVRYYFEIFDNDQVNGSKSSRSPVMNYKKATKEEFKEEEQANEEKINEALDKSLKEVMDIREKLKKLREELLQKSEVDWQDKKKLEDILKQQEELQKRLEEAKQANEQNLKNQEEFLNLPPEVQEKQERLKELFDKLANDELKKLMERVQELMNELNKEQSLQLINEMQLNQENLEKQTERLKELYKQLEVEKELNESIQELEKLAEEFEKLSEETLDEKSTDQELEQKHEELNQDFEELKDKMDDLKEKNDELEYPKPMEDDLPEQMDEINDELNESQKELKNNQKQSSSQKQKSAAGKMKEMAKSLQTEMMSGDMEQMQEDLETLRQLLENLVTLSFDQEDIVNGLNSSRVNTPKYTSLTQDQSKIKEDFKIVEDTLQALSKRQAEIETFITEKVNQINSNLDNSLVKLEAREKAEANQHQRFSMKNLNDLALMLSESMEQMQQQMAGMMSGSQMCTNPGGQGKMGSVPLDKITKGQEGLSEKLKEMIEKMNNGEGTNSKDFANSAAQQAALRKALQELQKEREEQGKGASGELQDIIDKMDKQEVDLVNKRLDNRMLMRQQQILTRLLEAEKADRERQFDSKRKSNEGENLKRKLPPSLEEYLKKRIAETDFFKSTSPELNSYYQFLVDEYFRALKAS